MNYDFIIDTLNRCGIVKKFYFYEILTKYKLYEQV